MTSCTIRVLGGFQVAVGGRTVPRAAWRHRRATELVKMLALADGHRLHREQVMAALWPQLAGPAAARNLRKALHYARRTLNGETALVVHADMIALWPARTLVVDAVQFDRAARAALATGDAGACREAAALYPGEVLPEDRYAPWAEEARDRLRLRQIALLQCAGEWERVLAIDPAAEAAHQGLMRRALAAGDRQAAIRQFERLRERLRVDLGLGPDADSVALYEQALALGAPAPPSAREQARALLARGIVHLNGGDFAAAATTAEAARALALEAGLGREMGEASALLGQLANIRGEWKDVFRTEFMTSVRRSPQIAEFAFDAHLCLAEFCLCGQTGHDEITAYAAELLAVAQEAGSVQGRGLAELLLGEAALFGDRLDAAERHLTAAAAAHAEAGAVSGEVITLQRQAELALACGDARTARARARRGLALGTDHALAPHLVVRMLAVRVEAAGSAGAAARAVEAGDAALQCEPVCQPCSIGFQIAAAMAFARAGRLAAARRRLDATERVAGMWPDGAWHAALWEARGVLRAAEGAHQQAAALFAEASDRYARFGRPRDAARCREAG